MRFYKKEKKYKLFICQSPLQMMRKSKRQIKPKTVFDPSETPSSMDIDKDEKEIEESTLLNNVSDINPWDVTNFESFVFYECPECNHKSQDCTTFARHAVLNHHDKARKNQL